MPKRQKKTKEEVTVEQFFPVDPSDVKHTVEKKYKKPDRKTLEKIEKIGKKTPKRKITKKKAVKKPIKKEFKIPKIKLKEKGYELIITEKPQAALKIASALGKSTKKALKTVPYYEVHKDGKDIIVACAVGHLFTLSQDKRGSKGHAVFEISWKPNSFVRKTDFSKKYYDALVKLIKDAGSLTVATDYDVEGEVIGLNVVRFIGGQKDANRMKFSTLTEKEINQSYKEKSKTLDWGQAIAGETRHYLDWFYGINLSRALMNAIKSTGSFRLMSVGRVQGPSLKLVVDRERKINEFKSIPYWQILIKLKEHDIELLHNKDIFNKKDLEKFKKLKGKTANVQTNKRERKISPNPPFNLTNLQTEAYRLNGITPSATLRIAQSLYLAGIISYPRTSSQKLPESINYNEILKKIAKKYKAEKLLTRKKPVEGRKSDSAHPSIYPTGDTKKLTSEELKIYDLIVKRFLSLFMEDAIVENKTIKAISDKLIFSTKGSSVKKASWLDIYPSTIKEKSIPDIEGDIKISDLRFEEKETQPPKRYSPASIVSELEKRNLGTKATRSSILETLYNRGYIKDKSIKATHMGISLIETLEKHSPIIIDEILTREFEKDMQNIQRSKKDFKKKEDKIIAKAKKTIEKIVVQFDKEEKEIGKELLDANIKMTEELKKENKLNICPECKKGNLTIKYSKKTRRYFVACGAYPDCTNTYTLPPHGLMKKADKICDKCGYPQIMAIRKGKRPWVFCFNPKCETNKERIEAYKKKLALEDSNF